MKVKDPELKKLSQQKSPLQNKTSVKVEKLNAKQLSRHFALNSMNIKLHIGILGPKKCGKTSLLKAFIYKTFNPSLKEDTILNIHKLIISAEYKPIEVIITEINIRSNTTNEKIAKELINSMDAIFLCHEMSEKDISFNEEDNNKTISYINNITNKKNINIYLVGCKLDQKFLSLGNDTANIYEKKPPYKLTTYGQRIKTFVDGKKIKKFFATSALLNLNITELFEHAIVSSIYSNYKNYYEQKKKVNKYIGDTSRDLDNKNIFDELDIKDDKLLDEDEFIQRCSIF